MCRLYGSIWCWVTWAAGGRACRIFAQATEVSRVVPGLKESINHERRATMWHTSTRVLFDSLLAASCHFETCVCFALAQDVPQFGHTIGPR